MLFRGKFVVPWKTEAVGTLARKFSATAPPLIEREQFENRCGSMNGGEYPLPDNDRANQLVNTRPVQK
jgi:hypothetical protein